MKALTICQPYAELILRGEKRVENREWPTRHRGSLLIHAGKSARWLQAGDLDRFPNMPFGAMVGGVTLVECVHVSRLGEFARSDPARWAWLPDHAHAHGPWCWIFENAHCLARPVACRGALGLWEVPAGLLDGATWIKPRCPLSADGNS